MTAIRNNSLKLHSSYPWYTSSKQSMPYSCVKKNIDGCGEIEFKCLI